MWEVGCLLMSAGRKELDMVISNDLCHRNVYHAHTVCSILGQKIGISCQIKQYLPKKKKQQLSFGFHGAHETTRRKYKYFTYVVIKSRVVSHQTSQIIRKEYQQNTVQQYLAGLNPSDLASCFVHYDEFWSKGCLLCLA